MKTAIIGLGSIGSRLARNLAGGGQAIIVADKTFAKAETLAGELGNAATPLRFDAALDAADVLVLAIPFAAARDLVSSNHAALAGKIVVDPSNPIEPDGKGGFQKTIAADQSSGELLSRLLPEGAELVKAFGTLSAESLGSATNRSPEKAVLFYATDYPEAGRVVANLIAASGFAPISVGGISHSMRIEVGGDLHEFGKLGRLVSASEANKLI